MKNAILILSLALLANSGYGHGFDVSTVEEAHEKADFIFAVKVVKVSKPTEEYSGEKPYPIEIEFVLIETLKGSPTTKTIAIYTHPAVVRTLEDGTVIHVWLEVLASGKELSVVKNKDYLFYAQKHGIQEDNPIIRIERIDPISEKQTITELLKESKKKSQQQSDRESTSKTAPSAVPEASHP